MGPHPTGGGQERERAADGFRCSVPRWMHGPSLAVLGCLHSTAASPALPIRFGAQSCSPGRRTQRVPRGRRPGPRRLHYTRHRGE